MCFCSLLAEKTCKNNCLSIPCCMCDCVDATYALTPWNCLCFIFLSFPFGCKSAKHISRIVSIISWSLFGMCTSAESLFSFALLKKIPRQETAVESRLNISEPKWDPDRVMLWFTLPGRNTEKSVERKGNQGRTELGGTEEQSQGSGRGQRCFSKGLTKWGQKSPRLATPKQTSSTYTAAAYMNTCSLTLQIICYIWFQVFFSLTETYSVCV